MPGIRRRLGPTVGLALAALAITVAVAGPANGAPGPLTVKLSVNSIKAPYARYSCEVTVEGLVAMSQAEARALLDSGHRVVIRIWGEDPIHDDLLLGPYILTRGGVPAWDRTYTSATASGLQLRLKVVVASVELDEDSYPDPGLRDELYAGVRLVDASGTTIRLGETNRIGGYDFSSPFSDRRCGGLPPAATSGS